jgi:hypothetical protein
MSQNKIVFLYLNYFVSQEKSNAYGIFDFGEFLFFQKVHMGIFPESLGKTPLLWGDSSHNNLTFTQSI